LTLVGNEVKVGDKAPGFAVVDKELKPVSLGDFQSKVKLISVTPSLDNRSATFRHGHQRAGFGLPDSIVVLNVSMTCVRNSTFCANAGIEKIKTLSDHATLHSACLGVLIKELRLLSRSIFVIDQKDVIT